MSLLLEHKQDNSRLVFSNFKIKKSYVHFIKKELQKNEGMKTLCLDGNLFGDEGLALICNSLLYSRLQNLDLRNNGLTEKSLIHLKALALKNRTLKNILF